MEGFEPTQPVPTGRSANPPTSSEETQPVRVGASPSRLPADASALRASELTLQPDQEPLPAWLIDFARQAENPSDEIDNDRTQQINLPARDFLAEQGELSKAEAAEPANHFSEINQFETQRGSWEKESRSPEDTKLPSQVFRHPIDEMRALLNEDSSRAADFIRAHLDDPDFRAESTRSLRDYLGLHPDNQLLWTLFEEITNSKPTERE